MTLFVSGTDTDVGKTAAVGWLANKFCAEGKSVVTQKLIQTGCAGVSEDILSHRKAMGIGLLPEDEDFTTCRYVLKYPASPHLACKMEGVAPDFNLIAENTRRLESRYDVVIIEGAGGIMVPLARGFLTIDYVAQNSLPLVLVVPSKLGSLNHALLNFEVCRQRNAEICGVIYNTYPAAPKEIEISTRAYIKEYLSKNFPKAFLRDMPFIK